MLTDAEVDVLAKELLNETIDQVLSWNADYFYEVYETHEGESVPVYGATSAEGYGSFLCEFMPLATVKKIIRESERIFDECPVIGINESGEVGRKPVSELLGKNRESTVRWMSLLATLNLIAFFRQGLSDMIVESVEDCKIIANAALAAAMSEAFAKANPEIPVKADARQDIEDAAKRVADKKRDFLRDHIKKLPHVLTPRGRGRPVGSTKPAEKRTQESAEFEARVEQTIRKLLLDTGKMPIKTAVAKEMGVGGWNRDSGTDNRLISFSAKLNRLGLNFDAISERVRLNK
ncbi:MAG: hypothetical protein H7Z16_02130 [Pyrinomonadaceae bacterium]|nr:hypothetical protein [Pyrinomonadaceae bacterium]